MNRSGLPASSGGPSTSSGMGMGGSSGSLAPMPEGRSHVTKVAEVFLTAGHAFQRLGDLALQLQTSRGESENEDSKWRDADITHMREALTRFAHELDTISDNVQQRTMKNIKVDIKRRTLVGDDTARRGNSPAVSQLAMTGGMSGGMAGMSGMAGGGPMAVQKRGAHMLSMPSTGLPPAAKRHAPTTTYTKFQPYSMSGAARMTVPARPPTSYLTEATVSGAQPLSTPLLNDPHHYMNSRSGTNY